MIIVQRHIFPKFGPGVLFQDWRGTPPSRNLANDAFVKTNNYSVFNWKYVASHEAGKKRISCY